MIWTCRIEAADSFPKGSGGVLAVLTEKHFGFRLSPDEMAATLASSIDAALPAILRHYAWRRIPLASPWTRVHYLRVRELDEPIEWRVTRDHELHLVCPESGITDNAARRMAECATMATRHFSPR